MGVINIFILLVVGSFVAFASAYIGSLMVLKRMSLVGDALSHVALPGMAIAISLNLSPTLGAFLALIFAVIGIWYFEKTSDTYPEALVGIFFTASLAIGILITKEVDLLEALFGSIEKVNLAEGIATIAISFAVIILGRSIYKKLLTIIVSEDLAKSSEINVDMVNLLYLLAVGVIVSLGIRFVGTLLTGALVIVPAVSAKNLTTSLKSYMFLSGILGVISGVVGILISQSINVIPGPVIVLVSIVIFILSYFIKVFVKK